MNFKKGLNLIIYRFRERGLEIFLLNNTDDDNWELPKGDASLSFDEKSAEDDNLIELDPSEKEDAWAVEGDWHDIPSLKNMLIEDAKYLKDKAKELESGTYVKIKEALKKVLPHQYQFLKELKDILTDRNSIKDL